MSSAGADLEDALERMLHGDEDAFRTVFRAVQPGLLRYLGVMVGQQDAEDVAAEAWSQASRALDSFRGTMDGFRGWITTIARNRALDHLRATGRRPSVPLPPEEMPDDVTADAAVGAEDAMSTERAIALIATLPREQAEAVLLRVVMGLDAKTTGEVLGRRPGAVRTASHRGLKALRDRLVEEQGRSGNTSGTPDAE